MQTTSGRSVDEFTRQPHVSVSVVSYNTPEDVVDLVAYLRASLAEVPDLLVDVLVWENGTSSPLLSELNRAVFGAAGQLRVEVQQNDQNLGFGAAHNANLSRACAPYFLILNPDIRISAPAISALIARLKSSPGLSGAAPLLTLPTGETQATARHLPSPSRELAALLLLDRWLPAASVVMPPPKRGVLQVVPQVAAAALAVRSEDLRAMGGFDECFFMYFEDVDLCRRLGRVGDIAVDGFIQAEHGAEGTARLYRWQTTALIELSRQKYYGKYHGRTVARLVACLTGLRCVIRAGLCRARNHPDDRERSKGYWFAASRVFNPDRALRDLRERLA